MIRQHGKEWVLYTRDGSSVLGRHPSPEGARRQEAAIMVRKHAKTAQAKLAEDLARSARVTAPDLVEFVAKYAGRKRQAKMMKRADLAEVQIPKGLFYEAVAGEPAAVADIKRLEESQAKKVFGGGSRALSSLFGKALLGRTRSPGASLTSREEKVVEKFPQLRQLSAGANPERTYAGARALTHSGLVAIPSAGIGAMTARLISQALGAEGAGRELATAGGAALGGLAGSVSSHALRQRHARRLEQYLRAHEQPEKIGSLNGVLPFFLGSLEKLGIALRPLVGPAAEAAEEAGKAIVRSLGLGAEEIAPGAARAMRGARSAVGQRGTAIFRGGEPPILEANPELMARGIMRARIPTNEIMVPSTSPQLMSGLAARMSTAPLAGLPGIGEEAVEGTVRRAVGAPLTPELAEAAARSRGLSADALSHEIALKRYQNMTGPLGITGEAVTRGTTPALQEAARLQEDAYRRLVERIGPAYAEMFKTSPDLFTSGLVVA